MPELIALNEARAADYNPDGKNSWLAYGRAFFVPSIL
jgi:hypothetical protein